MYIDVDFFTHIANPIYSLCHSAVHPIPVQKCTAIELPEIFLDHPIPPSVKPSSYANSYSPTPKYLQKPTQIEDICIKLIQTPAKQPPNKSVYRKYIVPRVLCSLGIFFQSLASALSSRTSILSSSSFSFPLLFLWSSELECIRVLPPLPLPSPLLFEGISLPSSLSIKTI